MMARSHTLIILITTILFINVSTSLQTPLHKTSSKNVTLNFDDLPTHDGFGKISSYRHLDFSSFTLVNTSAAASAGYISTNDTYCATSSHNALIAHRAKTPSLWPRIALDPLAHRLPGEAPFFSLHGMSMKPMNSSDLVVCIFIGAYGIDEHKSIRALDGLTVCSRQSSGGYIDISSVFPGWGATVNMVEISAEALVADGEDYEWVDWPFCVDDLTIEMREGEWEWPEPWWGILPLLPPLAPFKFDDQWGGAMGRGPKYSPFSEEAAVGFEYWKANGAKGTLLDRWYKARTL
jgi:hypothetical protein